MTAEEWRPVADYPGYMVSSLGRVMSIKFSRRRILKAALKPSGYLAVNLQRQGGHTRPVHQLVAFAFHGERPEGAQHVRHLDGNKLNNRADNLQHGSGSQNALDSVAHGTHASARKTHCPAGHVFSEENTRRYQGQRRCRACARDYARHVGNPRRAAANLRISA